ncbi:MAG: penicillin-binding protein activator [Marinobacter sp.]|uniref:penicillin-binding protein activator n=2 Tax=unclassified Marinobacter TaxID=83889 RepID=UPI00273AEC01|nr:penicillin-binding protein activator [Marinobacter sp. MDS2]MDP4548279.1 penicillin-binding protein activator [Marinobacter sp. MDS2]
MMTNRNSLPTFTLLVVLMTLFSGCASINLDTHVAETPEQALSIAADENDPQRAQRYLLRIASNYQTKGDHAAARKILLHDLLKSAEGQLLEQQRLLAMVSAIELEDRTWAEELAATSKTEDFLQYPSDLLARAANLQAQTQALAGEPLDAAMTLILLGQTDSSTSPQNIHDRIWNQLKTVDSQELQASNNKAIGFENQGWLELASTLRNTSGNLDAQGRLIRQWQNNWPGHPAAQTLPKELALMADISSSRPENIVLALPLNGPLASAGKAIRDGFIAAYYDDSTNRSKTDIRVVDTTNQSFLELYGKLSTSNADLIVGPLEKAGLTELSEMNTLPVPVLGLNYLPNDHKAPDGLYQYGLSAEDEARQIARQLAKDNITRILALIPSGEWGDRVTTALTNKLEETGVTVLHVQRFFPEDNLRAITADVLGVTASRQRAIDVERTIGLNVEFEPRPRQDAEAIVMVAAPTIARQFKPLFAFYFAGNLPVYAPSITYEGVPNPSRDRDLNNVIFTDIPWVLAEDNPLRSDAEKYLSGTKGQLGRLFAMGADAWQLSKRLPLLQQVKDAAINGHTGTLTMAPSGAIHREQLWAKFVNGSPEVLETKSPDALVSGE